jgi:uncharacterized protein YndB with AHSA1/START domain
MNDHTATSAYGVLTEPATLTLQRLLPGPIERVWDFLTQSELRRQWLAAGDMTMTVGSPFELTWRNDEISDPPGNKPEGFGKEHSMQSTITELDPPHRIAFTWNGSGDVSIDLQPRGDQVLLTLVHRQLPNRNTMLMVSAGWHAHLDILVTRVEGGMPSHFWDKWLSLKQDYDSRLPA